MSFGRFSRWGLLLLALGIWVPGCSDEAPAPAGSQEPASTAPATGTTEATGSDAIDSAANSTDATGTVDTGKPVDTGKAEAGSPTPAEEPMPATPSNAASSNAAGPGMNNAVASAAGKAPSAPTESGGGALEVDPKLPSYKPVPGVSGTLKSVGSDTMNNLMTFWGEGFRRHYPGVQIEIEGKGSGTAPPALISGTAQFGPMSRDMKESEIAEFKQKFGYEPTKLQTGVDLLAVYVNKDNPVESLSFPQVDAIFSQTRRLGHEPIETWKQAGVEGRMADMPISLYGRNAASGTYGFFKEKVLADGDFKASVKEQPGSSAVVQGISEDAAGIGYSGIGYKSPGVKAVALSKDGKGPAVEAISENVYNGKYPLFRFLIVYVNARPNAELDPVRREFIKYIFSKEGQEIVVKDGYFPIPASLAEKELAKVGIKRDSK